jgi:hypothetical protein
MASACLKNAIDKYWRKTAPHSIKEEERQLLKSHFLQFLSEPELKIARQMSVILGKLARFELPNNWPDLIPKLMQIIQEASVSLSPSPSAASSSSSSSSASTSQLINSRCLMSLHQIIKSLASKRLSNDRKLFEELSTNLIQMMQQLAFAYVQKCLVLNNNLVVKTDVEVTSSSPQELQEHSFYLDQAIICLKILHKLVLHGFNDNVENSAVGELMVHLLQSFHQLLAKHQQIATCAQQTLVDHFKEKYSYLIVLYVQILADYQETYPFNFVVTCMSECLHLIVQVCFTPQGKLLSFGKLSISLMNLMKSIIMCDKYKVRLVSTTTTRLGDDEQIRFRQHKAVEIKQAFLTRENMHQMLDFLFNEYLLVTDEELELWQESPEEFINEDGTDTDAWKYNNRACAETLFEAFVHEYHELVVPIVVELIQAYSKMDATTRGDPNQLNKSLIDRHVLLKDASYNCGSLAAWELVSNVDFDVWFR